MPVAAAVVAYLVDIGVERTCSATDYSSVVSPCAPAAVEAASG